MLRYQFFFFFVLTLPFYSIAETPNPQALPPDEQNQEIPPAPVPPLEKPKNQPPVKEPMVPPIPNNPQDTSDPQIKDPRVRSLAPPQKRPATPKPQVNPKATPIDSLAPSQEQQGSPQQLQKVEEILTEGFPNLETFSVQHEVRRHRLSFSGQFTPYFDDRGRNKELSLDANVLYGYTLGGGNFELGPFFSTQFKFEYDYDFDFDADDSLFRVGAFGEYYFFKNVTSRRYHLSVGVQFGYGLRDLRSEVSLAPYASMKFFVSDPTALFVDLRPYWLYVWGGGEVDFGTSFDFGLAHYFF